jgi:probable F420-dependent oxidoreductase
MHSASSRADWQAKVRKAASLGFGTIFLPDHFGDQLSPTPALMAAAEAADVRVGSLVYDNDYRHPVVLAMEAATLDLLTDGRLELGIGAGWMRTDYQQSGIPYDKPAIRVDRFEEALGVLKGCFGEGPFSFEGKYYKITDHNGFPKPVQKPHPPILIGGGGKRVLGIAGREADIVGVNPNLRAGEVGIDAGKDATAEATDRKLEWLKAGAGDRFDDLEINVLMFMAVQTDDRLGESAKFAPMFGLSAEEGLEVPHALVGTVDQMCEDMKSRRERWGISYYTFQEQLMDVMAPVVERMGGQ